MLNLAKMRKKAVALAHVYPVYSIEENKLILKDGRVALGFELQGAEMEKWTQSGYEEMNASFSGALKALPVGSVVQKTDIYYDRPYTDALSDKPYFERKTATYFLDRLMLFHKSYLFISFPAEKAIKTNSLNTLLAGLGRPLLKNPFTQIDIRMEEAEAMGSELAASLETVPDVRLHRLGDEALAILYYQYFNLQFDQTPDGFVRQMSNHLSSLTIGEKKVNMVTLKGQGSSAHPCVKNGYGVLSPFIYPLSLALPFPHVLSQHILIEDTEKRLKSLDNERKINNSLSFLSSQDNELKSAELDAFTADIRANNKRLVSMNLSVTLFDANDKLLKANLERTIAAFRQLSGAECFVESYDGANIFFANAPGNGYQIPDRWLLLPADYAACYANFTTSYQPDKTGDLLCDRFRNPLLVNLFNTSLNNQNCLTIGPSGSGKSYTMGSFITQRFERRARQIIIDVGGTYKNIMESLVGLHCYFEYDITHPLSFNPFLLDKKNGKYQLTGDKINFLTALLAILWKGADTKAPLTPAERAILVRIMPEYYTYLNENPSESPSLKNFYYYLKAVDGKKKMQADYQQEMQFFNLAELLVVLKPFVEGEYERVLNAAHEMDISDLPLVCFDMARIKSDPTLYPLISMLITELALDQIRKYPQVIKYLYMDEAWSMLSDSMGDWVESMYRTIRKNNGSMCIITQGIDEIVESPVGSAIIANASTQIILNHTDKNQVAKVARHLGFTTHEVDKINSIRKGSAYRELFIKQGDVSKVYCLEVCPHLDAVLSSKPLERNYLKELTRRYAGNIGFAVNQYVEDRELKKGIFEQEGSIDHSGSIDQKGAFNE
jgi:conjugation system TraG family ATPase